jgi:NOL1/NOP2/sun family putative RNA methylase
MKSSPTLSQELPQAFLSNMASLLGDEFDEFQSSLHRSASIGLRINTLKVSPQSFLAISPYKLSPLAWCSAGFIVDAVVDTPNILPPGKHPYHHAGLYYLQEPSAMAAAEILDPHPGEKVLDLAAAPGGKTTHLASLMKNTGMLVANEIHPRRVWDLAENLERCGVKNAIITNETPEHLAQHFGEYFDRVLLDAPCSGEGMFRKTAIARKEWKPELVHSCALRQSIILEQTARLVKPGGSIVYTTCTFSPEENEGVIDGFISKHPEFDLVSIPYLPGYQPARPEWIGLSSDDRVKQAVRIWPHLTQAEGHFIALLVKQGSTATQNSIVNPGKSKFSLRSKELKKPLTALAILDDFYRANLTITLDHTQLFFGGSYVFLLPVDSPDLRGLKVIYPGWWIGSIRKYRFIPSQALAMGIKSHQARHECPLTYGDPRLFAYFSGQSLPDLGEDGWVLVTVDGFSVGWGKRVQNVIKNYYPHGLRRSS